MTTKELKDTLHRDIETINDDEKLEQLKTILDTYILHTGETELSAEQLQKLEISRKQVNEGQFISNEDVDKEIDKWLNK